MRILFVSDFGFDVLAQSLLSGLVECGEEVVQYPYNPIYYGRVEGWDREALRFFISAAPPSWLPPADDPTERDLGRNIAGLAPQGSQIQYTRVASTPILSEAEMLASLSRGLFDLAVVVVGYLRSRQALVAAGRLADAGPFPPVVLVDLSRREDAVRWDVAEAFGAAAVFKNIVTRPDPRLAALPLSSPLAGKGIDFYRTLFGPDFRFDAPKKYDVHCNLSETFPARKALSEEVDRLCGKHGWTRAPKGPYGENLLGVHRSKVAFSMRGSELDTLHYWEIPSFRTAMFADGTMGAAHPRPFKDGETAVFYDPEDLSGLDGLLDRYLSDDAARIAVAEAGRRHCGRHHSNRARAGLFLKVVRERLSVPRSAA